MIAMEFDSTNIEARIEDIDEGIKSARMKMMVRIHTHVRRATVDTFKALKHGGTFRGEYWPPFADLHTRSDGPVPAYGGFRKRTAMLAKFGKAKERDQRVVVGRLRHSGRRVTLRSNLLNDDGNLMAAAARTRIIQQQGRLMFITTEGVPYAKDHVAGVDRPIRRFVFLTEDDQREFISIKMGVLREEGLRGR